MVRLLDDLGPLEKLTLIDMSYSRLDTFHNWCAAKYYFTYCLREPRGWGAPAALGNMVHSTLEHVDWTEPLDLSDMHQDLELQRAIHDPENKIPIELIDVGFDLLTEFVDRHDGEEFHVLGVEVPFAIVVGSALLCGYIDRVDRTPDGILVVDYKTGKFEVAAKRAHENLQLGIYALAMAQLYPNEQIRAELYYLRTGRRKGHVFTAEDLTNVESMLIDKIATVINTRHFSYTANVRLCGWCEHAESGACQVGARRNRNR